MSTVVGNLESVYADPTLDAMHRAVEQREAAIPPRKYLGASGLGDPCERKVWYQMTGAPAAPIAYSGLYAIAEGHRTEDLVAERLRMVPGVQLWTVDESGNQFGFSDYDGRFKGHIDGVITGLLQAPKTPHIWENKSTNPVKFKKFQDCVDKHGEKQALQNWDYTYYVQAQLYMGYFDLTRHYLTVTTPGGREIASCRTEFIPAFFQGQRDKAKRILDAKEPPARVMDNESYWLCKWCRFREHCYGV